MPRFRTSATVAASLTSALLGMGVLGACSSGSNAAEGTAAASSSGGDGHRAWWGRRAAPARGERAHCRSVRFDDAGAEPEPTDRGDVDRHDGVHQAGRRQRR